MRLRATLLALALALGCATDDPDDSPDGGAGGRISERRPGDCSITLAGDVSGTFSCVASVTRGPGEGGSVLAASGVNLGGNLERITIGVRIAGDPAVADYAPATFLGAGAAVQTADDHLFAASTTDRAALGALRVTRVELVSATGAGKLWDLDGSFSASLVDAATGRAITLTASF